MSACVSCFHLYRVDKNDGYWRWLCKEAPLPDWYNPVTGETVADPPYRTCQSVRRELGNDNECPRFLAGPNQIHPREAA